MVGVPGKSKGCNTCRARKIGCDQVRPFCGQCLRGKRVCEGYERFPIFLNRTASGLMKRKRLEDVKPRFLPLTAEEERLFRQQVALTHVRAHPVLPRINNCAILDANVLGVFLERYLPPDISAQLDARSILFKTAFGIARPSRLLQLSLSALSMTRVGHLQNDAALSMRGRSMYGRALIELHHGLTDRKRACEDETLLAAKVLSTYEMYESTAGNLESWAGHEMGIERLIKLRGPLGHQSRLAKSLLEDSRHIIAMRCLAANDTSFLAEKTWEIEPWANSYKSPSQKLWDKAFQTAAIIYDWKELIRISDNDNDHDSYRCHLNILVRCAMLHDDLIKWHEETLKELGVKSMHWRDWDNSISELESLAKGASLTPRTLLKAFSANLLATFWGIQSIVDTMIQNLCAHLLRYYHHSLSTDLDLRHPLEFVSHPRRSLLNSVILLAQRHDSDALWKLANDIVDAFSPALNEECGMIGAEKMAMALRAAVYVFQRNPGPELEKCYDCLRQLEGQFGLKFATDLMRHPVWCEGITMPSKEDLRRYQDAGRSLRRDSISSAELLSLEAAESADSSLHFAD